MFMFVWPLTKNKALVDLLTFEQMIYSQNGEDGILKAIFKKIGTTGKFCVEFGVGDGTTCNTRYLIEREEWKSLQMDMDSKAPVSVRREFITAENINDLFRKYGVPREFDLLSIDIDYNTYWVWKAIEGFFPRVVVIEYNGNIPPTQNIVVPYDPNVTWDGASYYHGSSLLALVNLGNFRGYSLVACDSNGINAFFVRNDLVKGRFVIRDMEKIYRPIWRKQRPSPKEWTTDILRPRV